MLTLKNLLAIVILLAAIGLTKAETIKVCNTCKVNDIATAVQVANDHDSLLFAPGIYLSPNILIDKALILIGEDGTVLDGDHQGHILIMAHDSITISGFRLINAGKSYTKDYAAIKAHRINHFLIEKNIIEKPYFGMLLEKSHFGVVRENKVKGSATREDDSGNGIHLWHCSDMIVSNNQTSQLRDGIYFEFVSNSVVKNNQSHHNVRYGLHFMFSNNNKYIGNHFHHNGAGVAVMFSKVILMENNRFDHNWGTASYGLLLKEIYDAEVINNHFEENTIAIFLEGTGRMNYKGNTFLSNGWAVKVSGGCYTNVFDGNNFVSNALDVSYNSKMNDNAFRNNYWSEYAGYDLDKDGVGDVPYRPVKLFSYIISKTPESIILLRSLFIDIINFSERVSPIFTPDKLIDPSPKMQMNP